MQPVQGRKATMATHASGDLRRAPVVGRAAPRATYDVARSCRTSALTILGLIAVFILLILI
ncbi:hypothetical protein CA982_00115 [Gordonia lacunae]|uniref:Uncharacterized protein n=2 Tax=Gordonia lacunae TaxID=417102 RepID=A0A2C9ZJ98_9ACTN|nr:hypothetical protein CA982_00115 [Gordonia lacunae]